VPGSIWWASKLSALLLCLAATLLCHYAQDTGGTIIFASLLAAATILVTALAVRRASMHIQYRRGLSGSVAKQ
jgi:hypothetical protein